MTDHTARSSPHWRKSSYSKGDNNCVEVTTATPGQVSIRDTKLAARSPILALTAAQWHALLTAIRANEVGA